MPRVSPSHAPHPPGRVSSSDAAAIAKLMPIVYDELRRVAQSYVTAEPPEATLEATAIVNEAYLRLVGQTRAHWASRAQFFAVASEMIRRILVDHARARRAAKRGGRVQRLTLSDTNVMTHSRQIDMLDLDEAIVELAGRSQRQARVVELRFFGGLSVEEAADELDISPRTVKGDWRVARAWLRHRLGA